MGNTGSHACLWDLNGQPHDLGTLGDTGSEALALDSAASVIVGRATVPSNTGYIVYHAFVWSGGTIQDLNGLIPTNSGWLLTEATGIDILPTLPPCGFGRQGDRVNRRPILTLSGDGFWR